MTSGKHENDLYIIWAPNQLLYQYYTDKGPLKVHLIYSRICERMSMERARRKRFQWAPPQMWWTLGQWPIWPTGKSGAGYIYYVTRSGKISCKSQFDERC